MSRCAHARLRHLIAHQPKTIYMKRPQKELKYLVREYEKKVSEAPAPIWMDAPDILDILDYYEQHNMYYESEQCMRLALKLHPDDPEVIVRRAYRLKNEGRWDEALSVVEKVEQQEALDVQFFYAEKALSEMRIDDAERHFVAGLAHERSIDQEMLLSSEGDPLGDNDLLLEISELFMDYGCVEKARKYVKMIAHDAPEYPRSQMLLAECAYQLGDMKAALAILDTIIDADPYNLDAWVMKADLHNEAKAWAECAEAAEYALAIDPKHEKALRFKACAALGQGNYDGVLEVFKDYRQLYPYDYTMALSAGEILLNKRDFQQAFDVLCFSNRNCPNDNPDKIRILTDIALTYSARHDMQHAYDTLLGICSLGMTYVDVLFHAANQAFDYGEIEFGKSALQHFVDHNTINPDQRLLVARMLCEHNLFAETTELWDRLLDVRDNQRTTAAPYLAYAARRLMRIGDYKFWLAYAIYQDPTLTNHIFRQIYPNCLPSEYLACARREFPES